MKKSILIASFFIGTFAFAQTAEQRAEIQKSIDKNELTRLEQKFQLDYEFQQQKISSYLSANPNAKKTFVKDGNVFMLHHIDAEGNPIYINTKDANQVSNAKINALYGGGSVNVNITGTNMVAGVWDGGQINANHELLAGNVTMQPSQTVNSAGGNNHMQAVSGIMVGKIITTSTNPNAATARGLAPNATARNYDWDNDLTEMASFAGSGFLISNHSYGYSNTTTNNIWNYGAYDETSKDWDALLKTTPLYLPFVAGGNEQQTTGNASATGFDNMTGSSASKNVMTVGAINADNSMSDYSNWGPTDDGRVKPDIVTLGTSINVPLYTGNNTYTGVDINSSGTSYAAPAAAAAGLLLQQYYFSLFNKYMTAASLKALMLHTADDAGNAGPDAKFGWGILNVENAAKTIKQMQTGGSAKLVEFTTNPTNNSSAEVSTSGTAGGISAKASICWTDDEGTEQTATNGINNTTSRLVYNFDILFRQQGTPFIDRRTFAPLSVTSPNNVATVSSTWFVNNVDNYRQANITTSNLGNNLIVYVRKNTTSPAAVKPFSVLLTGLNITNATLAVNENVINSATVFYNKVDGQIKMISNNTKDGFGAYKIYDMSGKILKAGTERGNTISFQNDNNGVYILIYQNNNKEETFKFRK
ncbi:S8 family peptidase [Halpernia frigidisoli]|uniref:Por secretion system C-terminal sorting domain-containing protein n=1 Tax=Halpernia frigidisoli TaxID=1125876 RepID=A0A1I3I606_9FLAO|nr:S8 family peptidase [Halpernia frigidisoli]SFI43362.1 Por secretion system C-terminal sorting domain-containing protein [Halpernia frigidisoli]